MIITVKDKNCVWIGVSTETTSWNLHEEDRLYEENFNLWRAEGGSNCLLASLCTHGRDLDLLHYRKHMGLSAPLSQKNLLLKFIPKLKNLLEECDMMDGKEGWQTLVVAKKDRAFVVLPTFTCYEVEDFDVRARYEEDYLYGAMMQNRHLPPAERIADAFRAVRELRPNKVFPIVIMNTETKERIIISE